MAGILSFAIYVAVNSPGRTRVEAALAEAKNQAQDAQEAGDVAAARIETMEREIADLEKQLEIAKASLDQRAEKLAATEQEALRLRGDLDKAVKQLAELTQKYADAQVKIAERLAAQAQVDAAEKGPAVAVAPAPAAEIEAGNVGKIKRGQKNGKNNNAANRPRGPLASLPRTSPSFSELDTNHDGRLSLDEYKAGFPDAVDVEKEFQSLDVNGDGTLSIDEYKAGHPDPPVVRTKRPKRK